MLPRPIFALPVFLIGASLLAATETIPSAAPDTAGKPKARLALGESAPEIAATFPDNKPIALAGLRASNPGKIIVLQFGSITDPIFRSHTAAVEKLATKYADRALFVLLYQREAHAADSADPLEINNSEGFNITDPVNLAERQKLATDATVRLHIKAQTTIVDAWNNTSSLRYGSYPNMTFIIDVAGNLQAGYPWMDTTKVQSALDTLIAGKPLPGELRGSVQHTGPAPFDPADAAMEMTGGRGPATIANVLDRLSLTDAQKQTIYPALANFLAEVQEFRQTANALPGRGRAGRAGAPPVPPAQGAAAGTTPKVSTPEEVQATQTTLRASATRLETLIKQSLAPKDATQLLDALATIAPQQRLFAGK